MVMEMPSPVCVGREFVRQYYTMLHEAPEHLHRFYSHNSSFVHGGVEKPGEEQPPVSGQADIHKKIMSLNFNDCHAKIRQVDSQATVGNAVVVQVTGELSNNGQPMRRFMQTFVLAPQSPKKYYVHNDIFRYQDEVFHDTDNDAEVVEETVGVCVSDSEQEAVDALPQETVQDPTVSSYYKQPEQPPLSNGNVMVEERTESPVLTNKSTTEEEEEEEEEDNEEEEKVLEEEEEPQELAPEDSTTVYEEKEPEKPAEPEVQPEAPKQTKPFSWADLASKSPSTGTGAPVASVQPVKPQPVVAKPEIKPDTMPGGPQPQRPPMSRGPRPDRVDRMDRPRDMRDMRDRDNGRVPSDMDDFNRPRMRYPDSQQLFVGNLPHNIGESDLKSYFLKYGRVLEVRINRKGPASSVPNFGFVIFDDSESVDKVLGDRPIMWDGNHRLNVEEKKQRGEQGRPGSGTRMGRGGPPMGRGGRGGMGGPLRGPDTRGPGGGGGRGGFGMRRPT